METVQAWVEASCASQRLPVQVADPGVLAQVASLLGATPGPSRVAASRTAPVSGAPDGAEAAGIETVVAASAGVDGDVVEDGGDDRVLTS